MDSRFIAWTFVSELPTLDLPDQIEFMRTRLGLETLEPRTHSASAGAGEMAVKDIDRIVAILSALRLQRRARAQDVAEAGGTGWPCRRLNLEGAPKKIGLDLVMYLTQQQDRVPPDNYTALGALLRTVMALPDIPPTGRELAEGADHALRVVAALRPSNPAPC